MNLVRLYTKTAAVIHLDKDQIIRPTNGWASVPESLVPHLLSTGWSRTAPNEPEEQMHKVSAPEVAAIESGDAITGAAISVEDQLHTGFTVSP